MNIKFENGGLKFEGPEQVITTGKKVIKTPLMEVQGELKCPNCGGHPKPEDVDLKNGTYKCPFCDTIVTLPNFGRTPEGPKVTNITNKYYFNGTGQMTGESDHTSSMQDINPVNILKTHLQDTLDVLFGK